MARHPYHYAGPERLSASITGVFFYGDRHPNDHVMKIVTIRGAVGQGGVSVGIGHRLGVYGPFGPEGAVTLSRTFSSPRAANGQSTYVGLEAGYVSLGRVSVGIARQVDGPSNRRDTILTWNVGLQIPYGFWRW